MRSRAYRGWVGGCVLYVLANRYFRTLQNARMLMKNPTLKILAVVSFIVLIFGGTAVFLALSLKDMKEQKEALEVQVQTLESQLQNCQ